MKRFAAFLITMTVIYIIAAVLFISVFPSISEKNENERSVVVNRINSELCAAVSEGEDPSAVLNRITENIHDNAPNKVFFISSDKGFGSSDSAFIASGGNGTYICPVHSENKLYGFAEYIYNDVNNTIYKRFIYIILLVCWTLSVIMASYIWFAILLPFRRLRDYPEKLAHLPDTDKLPETPNRRFGKFVWSMNMLADVLKNERKRAERLECQRQTLLASIAHGIKTPVMGIRLYAEAMKEGLYSNNSEHSHNELAEKIDANAQKIQELVSDIIKTSASAVTSYEPVIKPFYLNELSELIRNEYIKRLDVCRIPFSVKCLDNSIVNSDMYGIMRIISQLIDNAIKYGSGEGISVSLSRLSDGTEIIVRNKGELLPKDELTVIFDSFRRGSNSHDKPGSGIGLYTAWSTASALGGSICARRSEETSEMLFILFLGDS